MLHKLALTALCAAAVAACGGRGRSRDTTPRAAVEAVPAEGVQWATGSSPGSQVALLWGDPQGGGASGARYRYDAGSTVAEHRHAFGERAVVIRGTITLTQRGRPAVRLGPGGYYFVPADVPHAIGCASGERCEVYSEVVPRGG